MSESGRAVRGGVFALEPERLDGAAAPLAGPFAAALAGRGRFLATSHARGALEWLVQFIEARRVWLPAFLCDALLTPGVRERAAFFPVDERLAPEPGPWLHDLGPGDLAVPIAYFGWPPPPELIAAFRERGARVVVDASQALLTDRVEAGGDYALASPRKFVGVPDGGLLVPIGDAPWPAERPAFGPWAGLDEALAAGSARRAFDRDGGAGTDRSWYEHFAAAESAAARGPRSMSDETATRLAGGVDWPSVARARRANWSTLAAGLGGRQLFESLPDGVVPLGCPVRFASPAERDAARAALYEATIYAPWHWGLEGSVSAEFGAAHALSARVLTLPCDQRYDERDMADIGKVLASALGRGGAS